MEDGCDYSYAYCMNYIMGEIEDPDNHIIVFVSAALKKLFNLRNLQNSEQLAGTNGFACGVKHNNTDSIFYDTVELRNYEINSLKYGKYLDRLDIKLLFSRYFAAQASRIIEKKNIWMKLEKRRTNRRFPDENEFILRSWDGLLRDHLKES